MAKSKSLEEARAELATIRNDADHKVAHSMEKLFSEFVGATDRELRRAMQRQCAPIRAQEDAAIEAVAAALTAEDRKRLSTETLDQHLLEAWQR